MRIAIVIGHNSRAQGAVRVTDGRTEYDWNGVLADKIKALNPGAVGIFRRQPAATVGAEIRAAYALVDAWGADVSCELHFNANVSPGATGTETLFATSAGKVVAAKVQAAMVAALGLRDRGLVHRPAGNGALSLLTGKCPAVLTEAWFGSNAGDCETADARVDLLARAILVGLGGALAASPLPSPPRTLEARVDALERAVAQLLG
jgi:N-acetylmuramoyl-L-alanine amidase